MTQTIQMGAEFSAQYETRVLGAKKELAKVWPLPGCVVLTTALPDNELTPEQADELAAALTKAAEDARHLHHPEDVNSESLIEDRVSL